MNDNTTQKPVFVSTNQELGPCLMIAESQLEEIRQLLDAHHIGYEVDEEALSVDDEPEITFINLARGTSADQVRQLLESLPGTSR